MTFERDPVSVLWDGAAARLVARAYAAHGDLVATRIAAPDPRQRAWLAARGINPDGPDNSSAAGGGRGGPAPARTRWARGFVRSLHYNNTAGAALVVQVGRMLPPRGIIPAGRAVRVRVHARDAHAAAEGLPEAMRIFGDDGQPGDRWSDPDLRDW